MCLLLPPLHNVFRVLHVMHYVMFLAYAPIFRSTFIYFHVPFTVLHTLGDFS